MDTLPVVFSRRPGLDGLDVAVDRSRVPRWRFWALQPVALLAGAMNMLVSGGLTWHVGAGELFVYGVIGWGLVTVPATLWWRARRAGHEVCLRLTASALVLPGGRRVPWEHVERVSWWGWWLVIHERGGAWHAVWVEEGQPWDRYRLARWLEDHARSAPLAGIASPPLELSALVARSANVTECHDGNAT
ncbi:MAG: hypothetical protein EP330_06765 [Deltaproteobacteria bacterium]|nr:MAG: hypothetical protein EP330_06765 [Deltaproteobacteria bacterium]